MDRRHDRERRGERGDPVGQADGWSVGGPSGSPVDAANPPSPRPACRTRDDAGTGRSAEPGDPGQDQAGVLGAEPLVRQAPPFEGVGPEVLDDDVGFGRQPSERLAAARRREVQLDAALVPAQRLVPEVVPVLLGPVTTGRVRTSRMLDLDHVGTEVAEVHGRHRAGEERRRVDDEQVVQRAGHRPSSGSASDRSQASRNPMLVERPSPRPGTRYFAVVSGSSAVEVPRRPGGVSGRAALQQEEPGSAVRVLALREVPHLRSSPLEAGPAGGELPQLVLGRQPGAGPRGVRPRVRDVDLHAPGGRRPGRPPRGPASRDRAPRMAGLVAGRRDEASELGRRDLAGGDGDRVVHDDLALEGPLVVEPRRQGLPLVDERGAGVHPGLAVPVSHGERVVAGRDHDVGGGRLGPSRVHGYAGGRPVHERRRGRSRRIGREPGEVRTGGRRPDPRRSRRRGPPPRRPRRSAPAGSRSRRRSSLDRRPPGRATVASVSLGWQAR